MSSKVLKILSIVVAIAAFGIGQAASFIADKRMDATIAEKVAEALSKKGAGS